MATDNTDKSYFWYIRKKGKNWVLGLVDDSGTAVTSALNIEYWYDKVPNEISGDNDVLDIPVEFEHGFTMGVVDEVMRMMGKGGKKVETRRSRLGNVVNTYRADWEDAIYDAVHKQVEATQQPTTQPPIDLRMEDSGFSTRNEN